MDDQQRAADSDEERATPGAVVGATAAGVAPLPFLVVYALVFIAHGTFHPVQPPDITASKQGELFAGLVVVVLLVVLIVSLAWLHGGRRRWPFVLCQAAALATSVEFITDSTTGSPAVPLLLVLTSATALVLAFLPASWRYLGVRPGWHPRAVRGSADESGG